MSEWGYIATQNMPSFGYSPMPHELTITGAIMPYGAQLLINGWPYEVYHVDLVQRISFLRRG